MIERFLKRYSGPRRKLCDTGQILLELIVWIGIFVNLVFWFSSGFFKTYQAYKKRLYKESGYPRAVFKAPVEGG